MLRNPLAYGVAWEVLAGDPRLDARRKALVADAARELERCKASRVVLCCICQDTEQTA